MTLVHPRIVQMVEHFRSQAHSQAQDEFQSEEIGQPYFMNKERGLTSPDCSSGTQVTLMYATIKQGKVFFIVTRLLGPLG